MTTHTHTVRKSVSLRWQSSDCQPYGARRMRKSRRSVQKSIDWTTNQPIGGVIDRQKGLMSKKRFKCASSRDHFGEEMLTSVKSSNSSRPKQMGGSDSVAGLRIPTCTGTLPPISAWFPNEPTLNKFGCHLQDNEKRAPSDPAQPSTRPASQRIGCQTPNIVFIHSVDCTHANASMTADPFFRLGSRVSTAHTPIFTNDRRQLD